MDTSAGSAGVARTLDAALAIASAAVIAYGVLVLGWSVFIVMALFWFENVVIGGFNVLRMLVSGIRLGAVGMVGALFMAAFFTLHYGMFTAVHGVFVVMLFGAPELGREAMNGGFYGPLSNMVDRVFGDSEGWLAMMAIIAVHAVRFVQWSFATRELPTPLKELMGAPYGRIVVLHITLILGAFLIQVLQAPVLGVLLLLALKLGYDLMTLRHDPKKQEEGEAQTRARRLLMVGRRNLP
jgi:Family of unknown function (DUF6498)